MKKAENMGINNVMDAIDSKFLSYEDKIQYIEESFEDQNISTPSLNLRIKDLQRDLRLGEKPTFTLIESGVSNPCTSPKLEVFFVKGDLGLYDLKSDDPIFSGIIEYSCLDSKHLIPILNFWSEQDFPQFPRCSLEGTYLIVGDSGTEKHVLDEYYCR